MTFRSIWALVFQHLIRQTFSLHDCEVTHHFFLLFFFKKERKKGLKRREKKVFNRVLCDATQPPFWVSYTPARNSTLITHCLCSPSSTWRAMDGVLGSAQLGKRHRKSFVRANNITDKIKECNNVPVATRHGDSFSAPQSTLLSAVKLHLVLVAAKLAANLQLHKQYVSAHPISVLLKPCFHPKECFWADMQVYICLYW